MIAITDTISIDENEIREEFIRSSGPGGQNVNKVSTAVQLKFDVANSRSLPEYVKARLIQLAGKKINKEGMLTIKAQRHRTQDQNRKDALDRLIQLIQKAVERPKLRVKTKPTFASKKRRLKSKRHRSDIKRLRKPLDGDFDD